MSVRLSQGVFLYFAVNVNTRQDKKRFMMADGHENSVEVINQDILNCINILRTKKKKKPAKELIFRELKKIDKYDSLSSESFNDIIETLLREKKLYKKKGDDSYFVKEDLDNASISMDLLKLKETAINVDDRMDALYIPRPEESDSETIKSYENFIYAEVDNLKYEMLRRKVYDDVLKTVLDTVRNEFITPSYHNRMYLSKLDEKDELIKHLKSEIEFLREEVRHKNKNSTTESLMHDYVDFSHINPTSEINLRNNNVTFVPREGITEHVEDNARLERSTQLLNDQLITIRIEKHNNFLKYSNNTVHVKSKTTNKTIIEENVTDNSEIKKNVIICCDSIVNGLDSNGLSSKKCKAIVRSFSGATSGDLFDFIKPLANKKPDHIIIHIGTNDLTKNINNTADNIKEMLKNIRNTAPKTQVSLSNICLREDRVNLEGKRVVLNNTISELARQNCLKLISNNNIDSSCLSKRKLHLNKKGLAKLAINIKNHIHETDVN